jgi:transposase
MERAEIKALILGPEMFLGPIFDSIGFNKVKEPLLRHLVIGRICFPGSKLKTARYLTRYWNDYVDVSRIYRLMDRIAGKHKAEIEEISLKHTFEILGGTPAVVFYDVTTLYFEASEPDELRITGFSKDGKHQQPQIVLGLLVASEGYPLAYQIFEGNTFEGHTLIPVLGQFKTLLKLDRLIVVADAGLLNEANMQALEAAGEQYILGARIKSVSRSVGADILASKPLEGQVSIHNLEKGRRLVVTYSASRAKKDDANRTRGVNKLKKAIASGKLSKQNFTNRGYNKFVNLEGDVSLSLDEDKIAADTLWDGLKGYITNTQLPAEQVLEQYGQLWNIEKAFRISKTDLKVRPVFHYKRKRIEAHLCIAFCAYKVYKDFERQLKAKGAEIKVERAIQAIGGITQVTVTIPELPGQELKRLLTTDQDQQGLLELFQFG